MFQQYAVNISNVVRLTALVLCDDPCMPPTSESPEQVEKILGPYRLIERLGRGAMASVFRARAIGGTQDVALKLIHAAHDQRSQFEAVVNEAMAISAVRHPNVVSCLSYGSDGDYLYIIMELSENGDTVRLVQRNGRLDEQQALTLAAQCARGLEAIHAAGYIHRDIKPSNVMLDAEGIARIGDLGLGFPIAIADQAEGVVGTPAYMSPEQARGEKLDARTDIFSLGATLFYWITGRQLYSGKTALDTLRLAAVGQIHDVRQLAPELSPAVAAVLDMALAADREQRFPDARAFGQALALAQEGTTITPNARSDPHAKTEMLATVDSAPTFHTGPAAIRRPSWHIPVAVAAGAVSMAFLLTMALGRSPTGQNVPAADDIDAGISALATPYREIQVRWVGDSQLSFEERGEVRYARSGRWAIFSGGAALICTDPSSLIAPLIVADSFSIEVAFSVEDITQTGPARLLACGLNHKLANVTIGQAGSRIEVRCRTTMTNTDGTRPSLETEEGSLIPGQHHLIFVRHGQEHTLWLNGALVAKATVPGSLTAWDPALPLAIGDEARGGFPWSGRVDSLAFLTHAIDPSEVTRRYVAWSGENRS